MKKLKPSNAWIKYYTENHDKYKVDPDISIANRFIVMSHIYLDLLSWIDRECVYTGNSKTKTLDAIERKAKKMMNEKDRESMAEILAENRIHHSRRMRGIREAK